MKNKTCRRNAMFAAVLAAGLLCCAVPAMAKGETDPAGPSVEVAMTGVALDLPAEMKDLEGTVQSGFAGEIGQGSGIWITSFEYLAMTREKYDELVEKSGEMTEEDIEFLTPRMVEMLLVYTIDGGRGQDEVEAVIEENGLPAGELTPLGSEGGYSFFAMPDPYADQLDSLYVFDDSFREEYDAVVEACRQPGVIRVFEPEAASAGTAAAGTGITFETTDLDGNPVTAEEIFSENKVTMVNLWGTFCGPCINEMPDLEELSGRLADKDCGIIGVVIDITGPEDTAHIEVAKEIEADTGVTYMSILPWAGIDEMMPAQFVPTTYFVDADGQIVGEAAVGARFADEYEALLDEVLAQQP